MIYEYRLNVEFVADDPGCFAHLIQAFSEQLNREVANGLLLYQDGDRVEWSTTIHQQTKE